MHQIPSSLPPLFSGDRLVVYGVLKASENASEGDDNEVRLEGMLRNDENVKHVVKFSTPPITVENKTDALFHQLAAKSFIQEKQDGYSERNDGQEKEEAKRSTISISKSTSVVSKFTSFVAVDKDSNQPVSGPLRKHFVPYYLSADFSRPKGAFLSALARKKGGFGFSSSNSRPKFLATKKKSKGFFSSLFGSAAPPPVPEMEDECLFACPPRLENEFGGGVEESLSTCLDLGTMSQETKEASAALSVISLQKASGSWELDEDICELDADMCELDEEIHGSLAHRKAENYLCGALPPPQAQKRKDSSPVLALITLQKASGSWDLKDQLVSLSGTIRDVLIKGCPKEIAVDTAEGKLLWATALALVLLMGKFLDRKNEWEIIAEKGSKWMKKNLPAGVKYKNVLEAAATTVGVQVKVGQ